MFTLEIDGTAVAVINGDEETARDLFTCDGFKSDIRELTSAGKPLWNGTSELKVRPATEDEVEMFEDALADDDGSGDFEAVEAHADSEEDEDEADIVFLVDIDEEEEDDEDGQKLDA